MDDAIGSEGLRVVEPAALPAAILAGSEQAHRRDEILKALRRDLAARGDIEAGHSSADGPSALNRSARTSQAADPLVERAQRRIETRAEPSDAPRSQARACTKA